jgi:hypothetical protein
MRLLPEDAEDVHVSSISALGTQSDNYIMRLILF